MDTFPEKLQPRRCWSGGRSVSKTVLHPTYPEPYEPEWHPIHRSLLWVCNTSPEVPEVLLVSQQNLATLGREKSWLHWPTRKYLSASCNNASWGLPQCPQFFLWLKEWCLGWVSRNQLRLRNQLSEFFQIHTTRLNLFSRIGKRCMSALLVDSARLTPFPRLPEGRAPFRLQDQELP